MVIEILYQPNCMAHVTPPKVCSSDKVHKGISTSDEVAGYQGLTCNLLSCFNRYGGQGLPSVFVFYPLVLT